MPEENKTLIAQVFKKANYVHALGLQLVASGYGWCETELKVTEDHLQQHGFVHGGVLMAVADHTCGGAGSTTMPHDKELITVENKVSFLRPATGSSIFCRADVLRSGKTLVFVEAEIFGLRNNERVLLCKASSTLAVISLKS